MGVVGVGVTGGMAHHPVLDRHGTRVKVGDRLRAQICTGRYGQTKMVEVVVTDPHWPYCQLAVKDGVIRAEYDREAEVLRCAYTHQDWEHGHQAWAEIV